MKFCPQCGAQLDDAAVTCTNCGAAQAVVLPPTINVYDHTAEFNPKDIADNKIIAMTIYIFGLIGIVIAALITKDSPYVNFHIRQALKLTVVSALVGIITAVLCWTVIVPIVGGLAYLVIGVIRIICFVNVCTGKSEEPLIIRSIDFLN